jgi:hypothetical protein
MGRNSPRSLRHPLGLRDENWRVPFLWSVASLDEDRSWSTNEMTMQKEESEKLVRLMFLDDAQGTTDNFQTRGIF